MTWFTLEPALPSPVIDGIDLLAHRVKVDPHGNMTVSVQLWNGSILDSDQIELAMALARHKFAERLGAKVKIDPSLIDKAVLHLEAAIPQTLKAQAGVSTDDAEDSEKKTASERLVAIASEADLFHTPDGDTYATFLVGDHQETWLIKSKSFRRWLSQRFYEQAQQVPRSDAIHDALGVLEGRASFAGTERSVFVRLAECGGAIYIDLANERWEVVRITSEGFDIIADPPIRFRRSRGTLPLPVPTKGGTIDALRQFINIRTERDFILVVAWLVAALRASGPFPVLVLHGQQGSAKSTLARILRALVDPNVSPLRAEPRDGRDLMITATNSWCIALDNVSRLQDWLSDALCRLATGGGFTTRELYSDADEVIFDAKRPAILTGIEAVATRSDLLNRAIPVELNAIGESERMTEADLWSAFEATRPSILGALLEAVSSGLRHLATTKLDRLPRLADFAIWTTAAEAGLGWAPGTVMGAYAANQSAANDLALEASPVAAWLEELASADWAGTCDELLTRCARMAAESQYPSTTWTGSPLERDTAIQKRSDHLRTQAKDWPHNARAMREVLKRLAPNLAIAGVTVTFAGRKGHGGARTVTIKKVGEQPSPSTPPSPDTSNEMKTEQKGASDAFQQSPFGDGPTEPGDDRHHPTEDRHHQEANSGPKKGESASEAPSADDGDGGDGPADTYSDDDSEEI